MIRKTLLIGALAFSAVINSHASQAGWKAECEQIAAAKGITESIDPSNTKRGVFNTRQFPFSSTIEYGAAVENYMAKDEPEDYAAAMDRKAKWLQLLNVGIDVLQTTRKSSFNGWPWPASRSLPRPDATELELKVAAFRSLYAQTKSHIPEAFDPTTQAEGNGNDWEPSMKNFLMWLAHCIDTHEYCF